MSKKTYKSYDEYNLKIGNADISFFTDSGSLCEYLSEESGMHSHDYCELFYVTKGQLEIRTSGNNYILKEKDAALVPGGLEHCTIPVGKCQRTVISLTCTLNKSKSDKPYYNEFTKLTTESFINFVQFHGGDAFLRLARYHYGNYSEKKELILSCLHEIIVLMKEASQKSVKLSEDTIPDSILYRNYIIEQYIELHYADANLNDLSSMLHLSRQQTLRVVKALCQMSFEQKIVSTKLEKAAKLISSTDMSFEKIAEKVGYRYPHSLFSSFKKFYGITPLQYRKKKQ